MGTGAIKKAAFRAARWTAVLVTCAFFWWLVGSRLTLPAWQVAVLPAAILGWWSLYREKRWSIVLVMLLVVGCMASTAMGELSLTQARLAAATRRRAVDQKEAMLQALLGEQIQRAQGEAGNAPEVIELDAAAPTDAIVDWRLATQVTWSQRSRRWPEWLLSFGLALAAAFQAGRMTLFRSLKV